MSFVFILLVLFLFSFLLFFVKRLFGFRTLLIAFILEASWLLLLAGLAISGFFRDFASIPPHIALAVIPNIVLLLILAVHPAFKQIEQWQSIGAAWLIGFQSFRMIMEFILYRLVQERQIPDILTFTGGNFDILVGVTAPIAAWAAFRWGVKSFTLLKIWNIAGFLILLNTVVRALPETPLVREFPWIWLPGFVVPIALAGHILSFRQIRALQKRN